MPSLAALSGIWKQKSQSSLKTKHGKNQESNSSGIGILYVLGRKRLMPKQSIFGIMDVTVYLVKFQSQCLIKSISHHYCFFASIHANEVVSVTITEASHKSSNTVDVSRTVSKSQKMFLKKISFLKAKCFQKSGYYVLLWPVCIPFFFLSLPMGIPFDSIFQHLCKPHTTCHILGGLCEESMGGKN